MTRELLLLSLTAVILSLTLADQDFTLIHSLDGKWEMKQGNFSGIAQAKYTDSVATIGWGVLDIKVNGSYTDDKQAYAAGYDAVV
jgi:hypothetical protein